jgi:acetyl esterase/lipase
MPLEALRQNVDPPKPHSIMAICLSSDLSRENPIIKEVERHDPIFKVKFINETATRWAGEWDKKDPRISPLYSDQLGLFRQAGIKVDGCTAGYDILGPDGVLFRTKLAKNGVEGEWLQWEKMMHCWPIVKVYGISPESEEAFRWIVDILRRRSEEEGEETSTAVSNQDEDVTATEEMI